jgi:hypothetical protein
MRKTFFTVAIILLLARASHSAMAQTTAAKSLFDPARHMHVSEVRPGMKGFGLSVFSGSKIDKFDVEVIDVIKNFNTAHDVVLIRCKGDFLEHTGAIAGMSGSPIYLIDDAGNARMIGAFAYGWSLDKDPIAGVQPIEYMLDLPGNENNKSQDAANSGGVSSNKSGNQSAGGRWKLDEILGPPGHPRSIISLNSAGDSPGAIRLTDIASNRMGGPAELLPLATPLMVGGMSQRGMETFRKIFAGTGLVPMQAGSGSATTNPSSGAAVTEPGGVLAVPLLTGDMDASAIGTVTEVLGNRVFGFGHPFFGEGTISLPFGTGNIDTIVPLLSTSFKLGSFSQSIGELTTDQSVGISGFQGRTAPMAAIDVHVIYDDKTVDRTYHFLAVLHPKLTPAIVAAALSAALTSERELPTEFQTIDYQIETKFADGQSLAVSNLSVNSGAAEMANDALLPVVAMSSNPFKHVSISSVSATLHVSSEARIGQIQSVLVPRLKYEPGETLKAFVSYEPFRAAETSMPVELELPHDLPDGTYHLIVSDWQKFLNDERVASAFKFSADNINDVFSLVKYATSLRRDALYLRLVRKSDGVAVGRTALPQLPASQRQVLMDSGRSDITPFVSSTTKVIPTPLVMQGDANFDITIERKEKVAANPQQAQPQPQTPAQQSPNPGRGGAINPSQSVGNP